VLQDPWRKEPNPFPAHRTADLRFSYILICLVKWRLNVNRQFGLLITRDTNLFQGSLGFFCPHPVFSIFCPDASSLSLG